MMLHFNTSLVEFNHIDTANNNVFIESFKKQLSAKKIGKEQIIKLTVFYNHEDIIALPRIKELISGYFVTSPTICFIAQPPLCGSNITIEISYTVDGNVKLENKYHRQIKYTRVTVGNECHLFISGIEGMNKDQSIREQAEEAFVLLEEIFEIENYKFSDIVRQWNYIEDITMQNDSKQNYQIFNDVRTKYYEKNHLTSDYPAATGIGIKTGGIIIDVHAIKPVAELKRIEIANPLQIDAYKYSQKVLEGQPSEGYKQRTTPKFSRAKAVINNQNASILVSGTASIEGEVTIGIDQVELQTQVTIRNIERLIKAESIKSLLPVGKEQVKFSQTRVYIKYPHHIEQVKAICEGYFTTGEPVYIESDICRKDLLVEIECVATLI